MGGGQDREVESENDTGKNRVTVQVYFLQLELYSWNLADF